MICARAGVVLMALVVAGASPAQAGSSDGGVSSRAGWATVYGASVDAGGATLVTGSLSKDEIRAVIHAHRDDLRACADRHGPPPGMTRGRVTVSWSIIATGAVAEAKVKDAALGARQSAALAEVGS